MGRLDPDKPFTEAELSPEEWLVAIDPSIGVVGVVACPPSWEPPTDPSLLDPLVGTDVEGVVVSEIWPVE